MKLKYDKYPSFMIQTKELVRDEGGEYIEEVEYRVRYLPDRACSRCRRKNIFCWENVITHVMQDACLCCSYGIISKAQQDLIRAIENYEAGETRREHLLLARNIDFSNPIAQLEL